MTGQEHTTFVGEVFKRVAKRYDLANALMTWGQDRKWRREVIRRADIPKNGRLLDIGAGTGALSAEALHLDATIEVAAVDASPEMLQRGQQLRKRLPIGLINADAARLPFNNGVFDAVVSGYLLRNLLDLMPGLAEMHRVLKAGGVAVHLDTTPPPGDLLHLPALLYLRFIIPLMGGLVSGDRAAYQYLVDSTRQFMPPEVLQGKMIEAGFESVGFRRFMAGTMAIHWGKKQVSPASASD